MIFGRCDEELKIFKPQREGGPPWSISRHRLGSLVKADLGAFLSEAKTDKFGEPQSKSGASHPTSLPRWPLLPSCSALQGSEKLLT